MSQLALPLQLADHAVFASFLDSGNEMIVATLQGVANGEVRHGGFLWGKKSTGKTHLLQAVCARAGDRSVYLPMSAIAAIGPDVLQGMASRNLVCVDDVDRVASDPKWAAALFGLCNQLDDAGGQLLVSAGTSPRESEVQLPDLKSRLSKLPAFQLRELNDAQRTLALQLRAGHRGLQLPDETAAYLLKRNRRDMGSLYALLDRLDREALRAQRRLTIPFVREVLKNAASQ